MLSVLKPFLHAKLLSAFSLLYALIARIARPPTLSNCKMGGHVFSAKVAIIGIKKVNHVAPLLANYGPVDGLALRNIQAIQDKAAFHLSSLARFLFEAEFTRVNHVFGAAAGDVRKLLANALEGKKADRRNALAELSGLFVRETPRRGVRKNNDFGLHFFTSCLCYVVVKINLNRVVSQYPVYVDTVGICAFSFRCCIQKSDDRNRHILV